MDSKKILAEEERESVELSKIQKVIDVINREPKKELIVFIDIRDDKMYNILDIKENGSDELLPLNENVGSNLKITKEGLCYMETQLLSNYSISKQKHGEIIMLEMTPKSK